MDIKIAANNTELEELVIGAILLEPVCLMQVMQYLKPICFYSIASRETYIAILSLDKRNDIIDIVTVTEELKRTSKLETVGGAFAVSSFTNRVASTANVESHAAIIYEKFLLRELAGIGMKIHNLTHEPNADSLEILEMIQRDLTTIDYIGKSSVQIVGDVALKIINDNKNAIENPATLKVGINTGLYNIDSYFIKQKQELGIIAARPGMGKTAFMLALAKHTAIELKKPVAVFSLEMSAEKLVNRLMASEAKMSSEKIGRKTLDSKELQKLGGNISKLLDAPIYFDDTADLDITTLRGKIRRMKRDYGIEEVYIDYLQLMGGEKKGNREQEISYITRQLKKTAKQEDIPITALSQVSRELEKRATKKVQLSDLRESGAIEQDADWVLSLFRPEYYEVPANGIYEAETFDGKHLYSQDLLVLDCLKYREGALFKSALKFFGEFMLIENYDNPNMQTNTLNSLENNNTFLS